jgi:DNA mismatch repair protein MutS
MGARMLRSWIERPLLSPTLIGRRLNAVEELTRSVIIVGELTRLLKDVDDIERLISRVVTGSANARDLAAFAKSVETLPEIKRLLEPTTATLLREIAAIDIFEELRHEIEIALVDSPPLGVRDGGLIRDGYDAEVDRLRGLSENAKSELAKIEQTERERTGVKLKVGYNRVFGYYIEIPRGKSDDVPDDYTRRQTLANAERFVTPELKRLEADLLSAKDKLCAVEYEILTELRTQCAAKADAIRSAARDLSALDALVSLAVAAGENGYCMPEVDLSSTISVTDGRHPVVERTFNDTLFVPNDAHLNTQTDRVLIITGPNMAGKSTYMRQIALITLMAQIGSFVPAKYASIGIVDRIFTRIGASDNLSGGQSTFMVEMSEVAQILKYATSSSLIILDEVGRGTSTYDGMAIARAVLEYCADPDSIGAKTLFATHYHELSALENEIAGVRNSRVSVKKRGNEIVFLRRIIPGGADQSYGVEVAKLAGLPERVIRRARVLLTQLESMPRLDASDVGSDDSDDTPDNEQFTLAQASRDAVLDKLMTTDLNTLSPLEAMNLLFALKKELSD